MLDLIPDFGHHFALSLDFFLLVVEQFSIKVTLILALRRIDESYGVLRDPFLIHRFRSQTPHLLRFFLHVGSRLS